MSLRFKILRPDGERGARHKLLSGGKEVGDDFFDYESDTYRGLPVGNYVLHIPSSREAFEADSGARDFGPIQPYFGREIVFTISGNESDSVDLGEIRLESAPK